MDALIRLNFPEFNNNWKVWIVSKLHRSYENKRENCLKTGPKFRKENGIVGGAYQGFVGELATHWEIANEQLSAEEREIIISLNFS